MLQMHNVKYINEISNHKRIYLELVEKYARQIDQNSIIRIDIKFWVNLIEIFYVNKNFIACCQLNVCDKDANS